jgi:aspartate-semialdehyde dehydrogenase
MNRLLRIGIVGASSLLGKELAEELANSSFAAADIVLLDEEEAIGQITSVGDEAAFIRRIEPASFAAMDFVFFAGSAEVTGRHWMAARQAGASIVDLSEALGSEAGVLVRAPWVEDALRTSGPGKGVTLDLATTAVMPAHPVAAMLGLVAARCAGLDLTGVAATVLEPASERGQAGLDELHRQTVNLLSFQSLPQEVYGAQVAFNLLPALGEKAKGSLEATTRRIARDYRTTGRSLLPDLALQVIHAPVFHGYAISLLLESSRELNAEQIERALAGDHLDLVWDDSGVSDPPSNLSAAGQGDILVRVSRDEGKRVFLWMTADNLKLTALQAIACARELQALRPRGKVQ